MLDNIPEYRLPRICARCGLEPGIYSWRVEGQIERLDPLTIISLWFGFISFERYHYSFLVPVCSPCLKALQNSQRIVNFCGLIGAIFWVIIFWFYSIFIRNNSNDSLMVTMGIGLLFGGLVGWGFGWVIGSLIKVFHRGCIGSYDGKYFKFRNREFHRLFALQNPSLVKKIN